MNRQPRPPKPHSPKSSPAKARPSVTASATVPRARRAALPKLERKPIVAVAPARRAAFEVLQRVAEEDAYASNLLAAEQYDGLSREDHGLLVELVLGVLRWQRTLDFLIERYTKRPPNQLSFVPLLALRLGLYQLRFLTRIPAHAALNEAVNLVKLFEAPAAAPLVNAALRAATRDQATTLDALLAELPNETARASIAQSHPTWLMKRWQTRLGETAATALATVNNQAPRVAFRFNEESTPRAQTHDWLTQNGLQAVPSTLAPQAFVLAGGKLSAQAQPVRTGAIYLQDEASQLIAHLAAGTPAATEKPSEPINVAPAALDLCAAPGSKAMLLASLLPSLARVVACDLHAHRLRTLYELRERMGVLNLELRQLDATQPLPPEFVGAFDVVLLDAPCSGLGTLARHPEIKWRLREAKLKELAALQKQLLSNAARCLRTGGTLTYAVCSTEPEEGEEVIAWLHKTQPGWRDVTHARLTQLGLPAEDFLTNGAHAQPWGARTWPHRHGCEGFFFCSLEREE